MNRSYFRSGISLVTVTAIAVGCGGSGPSRPEAADPLVRLDASDLESRAELARAELTTAVDEKRFRATAPPAQEFAPDVPAIHLVATLRRLPTDADVMVVWRKDSDEGPMLSSRTNASDTFEFVSSLSPEGRRFRPGTYSVRVLVNGTDVGGVSFRILGEEADVSVRDLAVGRSLDHGTGSADRVGTRFERGVRRLVASFLVENAQPGMTATVIWSRQGKDFNETTMEISGTRRYRAEIEDRHGLAEGAYEVRVEIGSREMASLSFVVGESAGRPRVDRAGLASTLGRDNMPVRETTVFDRNATVVQCGLRFLDLPPDSEIVVLWTAQDDGTVMHTTRTRVPQGGSGTLGAAWETGGSLEPGRYEAVVKINGETAASLEFEVR